MIKQLRNLLVGGLLIGVFSGTVVNVATPTPVSAACGQFLTFPAWYDGLTKGSKCEIKSPSELSGKDEDKIPKYIGKIALNVVEILLQLVAYIAVGFVIYGGFTYLTSRGREQKITAGREMILNAIVGLVIAMFAALIVSFVGGRITS